MNFVTYFSPNSGCKSDKLQAKHSKLLEKNYVNIKIQVRGYTWICDKSLLNQTEYDAKNRSELHSSQVTPNKQIPTQHLSGYIIQPIISALNHKIGITIQCPEFLKSTVKIRKLSFNTLTWALQHSTTTKTTNAYPKIYK